MSHLPAPIIPPQPGIEARHQFGIWDGGKAAGIHNSQFKRQSTTFFIAKKNNFLKNTPYLYVQNTDQRIVVEMKKQIIIWDWNGTLLNDLHLCVDIANEIALPHGGAKMSVSRYKEVFGFPVTDYYTRIGVDFRRESLDALAKRFTGSYYGRVRNCKLHDRTRETLEFFASNGVRQYILTAAHRHEVVDLLSHFSIAKHFTAVAGLDNHRAESKVEAGRQLFAENNIPGATAVLIGDTVHDHEVAKALGIDCILIANGHQSKERLIQKVTPGTAVINSLTELPGLFTFDR